MTLIELLDELARREVQLWAEGESLRLRAPVGAVDTVLQNELKTHKSELLTRLRGRRNEEPPTLPESVPLNGDLPLSLAQQSLWFLHRMKPASSAAYNIRAARLLRGPLQLEVLRSAMTLVVARHPQLRAYFVPVDEHPVARLAATVELPWSVVDLRGQSPAEQEQTLAQALDEEGRRVFALTQAPLCHVRWFQLGDEHFFLILNAHHLVADAVSAGIMLRDLVAIYSASVADRPPELAALRYHYLDFVHWQQRWLTEQGATHLAFWEEELRDLPTLQLPTDRPRPAVQSYDGRSAPWTLSAALTAGLRQLSREQGATLFVTLLTAFAVLLSRWSGQLDLPLGTSVAGRERPEMADVVGFFVNLVVLRQDLAGRPTFRQLLDRVRQRVLAAFAHQEMPFDVLVKELRPERRLDRNPLFQVLFLFLPVVRDPFRSLGFAAENVSIPSVTAKFDLSLNSEEVGDAVRGLMEYNPALFDAATIERWIGAWELLLTAAVADPDQGVAALPLLGAAERDELVWGRNQVQAVALPEATLNDAFAAQVRRTPERIALGDPHHGMTYRELAARANQLAHRLRAVGVGPETLVAIYLERSPDVVVAVLAVLSAGGAYLPIDPADPGERVAYLLADSGARCLLSTAALDARLGNAAPSCVRLHLDVAAPAAALTEGPLPARADAANPAYVIYTSGSTGQPKGVLVSHANVTRLLAATAELYGFSAADVWTLFHSLAFDFSVWEIWGALLYGGRLVVVPYLTSRSPEALHRLLVDQAVTVLNQTPSAFRQLIAWEGTLEVRPPLALRQVIFGGEALDPAMLQPWFERHGEAGPALVNMYGITETTVHVTYRALTLADAVQRRGSVIGARLPDLELYLVDPALQPVPIGVAGELAVGGAGLARGYLNRPALTAERFVPNPFAAGRLYKSGDLARFLADGDLLYLGRRDLQVKVRGFRIELGEIENALREHPAVADCVVLAQPQTSGQRLVAYVVQADAHLQVAALAEHLRAKLPAHMVPAAFVVRTAFPLTRNGKIDRSALPDPDWSEAVSRQAYSAPRTRSEKILCAIWSAVLRVERVGIDDPFFALGGDSILTLEVVSRARRQGIELSLQDIYRAQTVRALAAAAASEPSADGVLGQAPFSLITAADRERLPPSAVDAYPLTSLQAGMLYHTEHAPGSAIFHDIFSYHLRAPWDVSAWRRALDDLAATHEILRTAFDWTSYSQPLQIVHAQATIPLTVEDLAEWPAAEQETAIREWLENEKRQAFDETQAALLRAHLQRRSVDTFQLTISFHHAILDGWSMATLATQLFQLYPYHLGQGEKPAAPPPDTRFCDFVALERATLDDPRARDFWRQELADLPATRLPRPPGARATDAAAREVVQQPVNFDIELSQQLLAFARQAGVSLKSALLAAHFRILAWLASSREVVSGYTLHGRPESEGARQVLGLFLNTAPLRFRLPSGSWRELAQATFDQERRILPFRRYPMAEMKRLNQGRELFQASFDFVHMHVYEETFASSVLAVQGVEFFEETDFTFLAQFALNPRTSALELTLSYDASAFAASQIERIAGYFKRAFTAMVETPQAPHFAAQLLTDAELRFLRTAGLAETPSADPWPEDLASWFQAVAAREATRVALVAEGETLTYGELAARVLDLAGVLSERGVKAEERVAIALPRSSELVIAVLAVLAAGGVVVPCDPVLPEAHRRALLTVFASSFLLSSSAVAPLAFGGPTLLLDAEPRPVAASPRPRPPRIHPTQAALVIDRTGAPGAPQGCVLDHRSLRQLLVLGRDWLGLAREDVSLLLHPCLLEPFVWELFGALLWGGRLVVAPASASASADELLAVLAREEVTVLHHTAAGFRRLVQADETSLEILRLRLVVCGGDGLDAASLASWFERHAVDEPRLLHVPSSATTTFHTTSRVLDRAPDAADSWAQPVPRLGLRLLDRNLQPVPIGVPGELWVPADVVGRGFIGRPSQTAEQFVPDPLGPVGGRLYRVGERGRVWEDGRLEHLAPGREALSTWGDGFGGDETELDEPYVAPRNAVEARLAELFSEVLKVQPVGVQHNFFSLGGDSILATQLVSRIRLAFATDLPLKALFDRPSIAELAPILAEPAPAIATSASPGPMLARSRERRTRVEVSRDGILLQAEALPETTLPETAITSRTTREE